MLSQFVGLRYGGGGERVGRGGFTAKISHSSSVPPREARTSAFEAFIQNRTFLARTMVSYFFFFIRTLVS